MGRVLSRVPVAIAADASGVIVTVNQLGIVVGIATFGTLYLNLAGRLPAVAGARQLGRVRALVGRTPTWPCRSRSPRWRSRARRCPGPRPVAQHAGDRRGHALAAARQ